MRENRPFTGLAICFDIIWGEKDSYQPVNIRLTRSEKSAVAVAGRKGGGFLRDNSY
jgi:hypothetical protein